MVQLANSDFWKAPLNITKPYTAHFKIENRETWYDFPLLGFSWC